MPIAKTFTLSEEVVEYLETLPKREKSKFVSSALAKAILEKKKVDALALLDSIVPVESDKGSAELVDDFRKDRLEYLLNRHP